MTFLPKDYQEEETVSGYMKLVDGTNSFRILGSAVTGFEYWALENNKPVPIRSKEEPEETPNIKKGKNGQNEPVKSFWAFPVWNYKAFKNKKGEWQGMVQILEITQKTIKSGITSLINNPKWGDVFKYDIAIIRTTEGDKTTYQVQAEPPIGEVSDDIKKAFEDKKINLNALFDGEDPFK